MSFVSVQEILATASACSASSGIHILTLILAVFLSFYGLWGYVRYASDIFKNSHLLGMAFALMVFVPIADLFGHFNYFPGSEVWDRLHLFMGIAAFYFIYRFVVLIESTEKEDPKKSFAQVAAIALIAALLAQEKNLFNDQDPVRVIVVYTSIFALAVFFNYLLFEILRKIRKLEASFSLKTFVITTTQPISFALFILILSTIFAEFLANITKNTAHPFISFLIMLQNPLYLVLAMTLADFTYMGGKVCCFYSPLQKFLGTKKTAGKMAECCIPESAAKPEVPEQKK